MTGDDIAAVCKAATEAFGTLAIPVDVPGFAGSKNLGCKLGGEMMFRHVIGTQEPERTTDTDINIIGDYNLSGELWQIKPLLDRLGIRILGSLSADARYRQVAQMHRARVTMLVCSHALLGLARKMEEKYGIPFFEGSFYGISDTSEALRTMCRMLVARGADEGLIDRCEALTPAEIEEIVRLVRAFGLKPIVLPDLSFSLDGHLAKDWSGCSLGGTSLDAIPAMARSAVTFAVGESMRGAADLLGQRGHMPVQVFPSLTGLQAVDNFVGALKDVAGVSDAPPAVKWDRARLQDAMLDAHFQTGGLRYAIAADPDLT